MFRFTTRKSPPATMVMNGGREVGVVTNPHYREEDRPTSLGKRVSAPPLVGNPHPTGKSGAHPEGNVAPEQPRERQPDDKLGSGARSRELDRERGAGGGGRQSEGGGGEEGPRARGLQGQPGPWTPVILITAVA